MDRPSIRGPALVDDVPAVGTANASVAGNRADLPVAVEGTRVATVGTEKRRLAVGVLVVGRGP
ncbi:hypothetical protein ACFQL0_03805 [Haloplanus litoreus]|uniref:hypothetical protein n=1 Tax=Haloplanus litoreus TaxID=767515 RepID=UPI003612C81D